MARVKKVSPPPAQKAEVDFKVSEKLAPLLRPARYKAAFGGRGGGKSHFFGGKVVLKTLESRCRIVCLREVQNTIKESVRHLIVSKIHEWGLGELYDFGRGGDIRGPHGSEIIFRGMQDYTAENIKSLEDFDYCWVEEAQTFGARSLRILRPTLRKEDSEIWFSWNPRYETDPVDKFFRGGAMPSNTIAAEVNWNDNPWISRTLLNEKDDDYANDPEMAVHVWEGGYEISSEASYYGKWIKDAEDHGRIGDFPYLPNFRVQTAWDIGVDDYTAVWFIQECGDHVRVLDYYETQGDGAPQIVEAVMPELIEDTKAAARRLLQIERTTPFRYGVHYLPHDVKVREWGSGARSRVESLRALGVKPIHKGANQGPEERIEASRQLLPITCFNDSKRVKLGLQRLRRYSRKKNEKLDIYLGPLHDDNSHGADAFGEYAVNCPLIDRPDRLPDPRRLGSGQVYLEGPPEEHRTGRRIRV